MGWKARECAALTSSLPSGGSWVAMASPASTGRPTPAGEHQRLLHPWASVRSHGLQIPWDSRLLAALPGAQGLAEAGAKSCGGAVNMPHTGHGLRGVMAMGGCCTHEHTEFGEGSVHGRELWRSGSRGASDNGRTPGGHPGPPREEMPCPHYCRPAVGTTAPGCLISQSIGTGLGPQGQVTSGAGRAWPPGSRCGTAVTKWQLTSLW